MTVTAVVIVTKTTVKAGTAKIVTETTVMTTMRTVKGMKVTVTKIRVSNSDRTERDR